MRFELIDRVTEHDESRLVAHKNVTAAEEYLGDHFPGFPVLPGVMMLEALVQAGRAFVSRATDPAQQVRRPLIVDQVRNIRYGNMVRPGETLEVEVTLKKFEPGKKGKDGKDGEEGEEGEKNALPTWEFSGVGRVNDQVAVQGKFRLTPLEPEV